jgi:hypothetical protein
MSQRDARSREIALQAVDFTAYFGLATASSQTCRPATWSLILTALQIGGLVAVHFKAHFKRARPVQVWPAIAPAIPTPGHASYPNAHALQSHLIARCVGAAAPATKKICLQIANRIAENREVGGLHFPSDTRDGILAANQIMNFLETQKVARFNEIFKAAEAEWPKKVQSEQPPKDYDHKAFPTADAEAPPSP